jgi:hypothetical protein
MGELNLAGREDAALVLGIVLPVALESALRVGTLRPNEGDTFIAAFVAGIHRRLKPVVVYEAIRVALGALAVSIRDLEVALADATEVDAARAAVDGAQAQVDALSAPSDLANELSVAGQVLETTRTVIDLADNGEPAVAALRAATSAVAVAIGLADDVGLDSVIGPELRALLPGGAGDPVVDLVITEVGPLLPAEVDWLAELAGTDRAGLLQTVLRVGPGPGDVDHGGVVEGVLAAVENRVLPALSGAVADDLQTIVIAPLLAVVSGILRDLDVPDDDSVTLARERVSALLIVSLGSFALTAGDVCARRALDTAADEIDALIESLEHDEHGEAARWIRSDIEVIASWALRLALHAGNIARLLRFSKEFVAVAQAIRPPCVAVARAAIRAAPHALLALEMPGAHEPNVAPLARRAAGVIGATAVNQLPRLMKLWVELTASTVTQVVEIVSEGAGLLVGYAIKGIDALAEKILGHDIDLNEWVGKAARKLEELMDALGDLLDGVQEQIDKIGDELEEWLKEVLPGSLLDGVGDVVGWAWDLFTAPVKFGLEFMALVPRQMEAFFRGIADGALAGQDGFSEARARLASGPIQDGEVVRGDDRAQVPASVQYQIAVNHLATDVPDIPGFSAEAMEALRPRYVKGMRNSDRLAKEHRDIVLEKRAVGAALEQSQLELAELEKLKQAMRADPDRLAITLTVGEGSSSDGVIHCADGTPIEITLFGANTGFDGSEVAVGLTGSLLQQWVDTVSVYGWRRISEGASDWRWTGVLLTKPPPTRAEIAAIEGPRRLDELLEWKLRPLPPDVEIPGLFGVPHDRVGGGPPFDDVPREPWLLDPRSPGFAERDSVLANTTYRRRGTLAEMSGIADSPASGKRRREGTEEGQGRGERRANLGADPVHQDGASRPPAAEATFRLKRVSRDERLTLDLRNRIKPTLELLPGVQWLTVVFADGFIDPVEAHVAISFVSAPPLPLPSGFPH